MYITQELEGIDLLKEKAVCYKIDSLMKKGKAIFMNFWGKKFADQEAEFDIDVAETAWPNFSTFYKRFKDSPSLGPGAVEDSAASSDVAREEVVNMEQ